MQTLNLIFWDFTDIWVSLSFGNLFQIMHILKAYTCSGHYRLNFLIFTILDISHNIS